MEGDGREGQILPLGLKGPRDLGEGETPTMWNDPAGIQWSWGGVGWCGDGRGGSGVQG